MLNRAHGSAGSLIGAAGLITEAAGNDEELVTGVPGKVRRPLAADELDHIRTNARSSLDLMTHHRAGQR